MAVDSAQKMLNTNCIFIRNTKPGREFFKAHSTQLKILSGEIGGDPTVIRRLKISSAVCIAKHASEHAASALMQAKKTEEDEKLQEHYEKCAKLAESKKYFDRLEFSLGASTLAMIGVGVTFGAILTPVWPVFAFLLAFSFMVPSAIVTHKFFTKKEQEYKLIRESLLKPQPREVDCGCASCKPNLDVIK
ncbi:MAG: hypothetical protein ABIH99_02700 [Candidatus Micrarchaeota archaeon]